MITLYDGERYEGIPGERKFRIVRFAENTIPVRLPPMSDGALQLERRADARCSQVRATRFSAAEFHWRLAVPDHGRGHGAHRRAARRGCVRARAVTRASAFAILIFYLYIQLAIAGKMWLERGVTPEWLGLWWVHAGWRCSAPCSSCSCRDGSRAQRYRRNMARAARRGRRRMNLLDRYVIRAVLGGVFVVLAVLLTLGALFRLPTSRTTSARARIRRSMRSGSCC